MTKEEFDRAYEIASAIVATWPLWKQNILDDNPTVPRRPILTLDT